MYHTLEDVKIMLVHLGEIGSIIYRPQQRLSRPVIERSLSPQRFNGIITEVQVGIGQSDNIR